MSEKLKNQIVWDEFRKGSKIALETIYEDNYASLYHYGQKFTQDNDLIKDLIHELFIELIDSGSRLSRTDNIRYYLLKSLRNKLLRQLSEKLKFTNKLTGSADFNLVDSIESQLIKNEVEEQLRNQVTTAIKKLSVKQQEIIYLRFYSDISYQEIATLFDVNIQTVRNLMSRAINSLKEDLQNNNLSKHLILFVLNCSI
ncbi:MAG: hypothetical protein A2491_17745 [Bacteroidetes bacterium RIFOXYC12_FULL_35_7]|nr:MAG: hypothetical protein A2491_17745 [Bacteroidetes bacterium RIFOXYC12_FULL_35_7]